MAVRSPETTTTSDYSTTPVNFSASQFKLIYHHKINYCILTLILTDIYLPLFWYFPGFWNQHSFWRDSKCERDIESLITLRVDGFQQGGKSRRWLIYITKLLNSTILILNHSNAISLNTYFHNQYLTDSLRDADMWNLACTRAFLTSPWTDWAGASQLMLVRCHSQSGDNNYPRCASQRST